MKSALLASIIGSVGLLYANMASAVEIEYWQYVFDTRVKAMDKLIENFEKEHPDIQVKQVTFPYADYQTRVVAATLAKKGPDVVQLFYGWTDQFVKGKVIQPLNPEVFPTKEIEEEFFPIVSAMKRGEHYYGLPTAVRSLALFYNKDLLAKAGVEPPKTLDELVGVAEKITQRDAGGNIQTAGITLDMAGQDHHWWKEVLIRQYGGVPYSDDSKKVAYNDEAGLKALEYYTDLQTKYKVGLSGFMDEGQAAFRAGRAGMTIDGTFRLGAFQTIDQFKWGVVELPANAEGVRSNYASYFANGIGSGSKGEKLKAAETFLKYLTSDEAMQLWLKEVGELPARRSVALTEENLANPIYAPFLKGLEYAHTTIFVDEAKQRQVVIDMVNHVLLNKEQPKKALQQAAKAEQKLLDRFYR